MNCDEIKDMMTLYIDGELDEKDKIIYEEHMKQCENCRNEFEEYKKILNMLHNMTEEEPPKGYCKRLHEKLLKVNAHSKANKKIKWMKYGCIAAAFVLVISAIYMSSINGGLRGGKAKSENSVSYDSAMSTQEAPMAPENGAMGSGVKSETSSGQSAVNDSVASPKIMMDSVAPDDKEMKLIKSGYIIAQTESYDTFMNALISQVKLLGGYLEQNVTDVSSVYDNKELKYGNLIIRVPQDKFYEFVDYIEKSCKVNQKNITETDVTKDYYEKDNQVKNLELQESHLRELFDKAQTVEEMLLIENELRRVRTEIDALNISLSDIDDRASMSTISLQVQEVLNANFTLSYRDSVWERARDGFINTINGIVEVAQNILIWIISVSPLVIPILIIIIVIVFVKKIKNRK